jgi:hypothetical protein
MSFPFNHIRYHYIREAIVNNSISVVHVPEKDIADVLTKGLDKFKHYKLIEMMGLKKFGKSHVSEDTVNLVSKCNSDISINQFDFTHINRYKDNKLICQKVICKLGDDVES